MRRGAERPEGAREPALPRVVGLGQELRFRSTEELLVFLSRCFAAAGHMSRDEDYGPEE